MLTQLKTQYPDGIFSWSIEQLDQKHQLYNLANVLDWSVFDKTFKQFYSEKIEAPSKLIRLMLSL